MKKISLALGGGGARGMAHVGALRVVEKTGLPLAEIAGTSIGAIVGAYYAVHGHLRQLEWFAAGMDRKRTLSFMDVTLPRHALLKGERFRQQMEEWFGGARIEDARIPLAIVATNLRTGKAEVFRRGNVVDALCASAAIPGLIPAVEIKGEYYVDGGAAMQVPVAALRKRGTVKVAIELPITATPKSGFTEQPSLGEVLSLVYWTQRRQSQRLAGLKDVIVLRPVTGGFRETLSFHKSRKFLTAGEKAARNALPRIRKALAPVRRAASAGRRRTRGRP